MPEIPPVPTDDLSWATDEAPLAPPQGRREDGWIPASAGVPGEHPAIQELDWHAYEMGQRLESAVASSPRVFDNAPDAIDATVPGEVFYLDEATDWFGWQIKQTNSPGTAVEHICSDGRRVYYVQNGLLVAATANPGSIGAEVEWTVNLAAQGITTAVTHLACDGQLVALGAATAGTNNLLIVNSVTQAIVFAGNTPGGPAFGVIRVACDSDTTTQRIYASEANAVLYQWTPLGGFQLAIAAATGSIGSIYPCKQGFTRTGTVGGGTQLLVELWDRALPANLLSSASISPLPSAGNLKLTGRCMGGHVYWVPPVAIAPPPYDIWPERVIGAPLWNYDSNRVYAGNATSFEVSGFDDKYLWFQDATHIVAVSHSTGMVAYELEKGIAADATTSWSDAQNYWINTQPGHVSVNLRLISFAVARQRGYWIRTVGDPSTWEHGLLAVPLTRADGGARI